MFPGINFWKITDIFAGWALSGINYRFQSFSGFTPLAGQITGIGLKAINSSKKVLKITGPALFRINSVIISARTVVFGQDIPVTSGAHTSGYPWRPLDVGQKLYARRLRLLS